MEEKLAQAAPNNGASNATDFQPPTRNPQNISEGLVQQQSEFQNVTNPQEFLNERQGTEISVTSNPAPASASAKPTNDATGLTILLIIIVIGLGLFYKLFRRYPRTLDKATVDSLNDAGVEEPTKADTAPSTEARAKKPKTAPKRKGSKKAKRRNR